MDKKPVYLRCVDKENNHYKYYKMTPVDNNTFVAEWGREGTGGAQSMSYPMSKWNSKYNDKIRKGYMDKSEHYALEAVSATPADVSRVAKDGSVYAEIPDEAIRTLVNQLIQMSKDAVKANYSISATHVTQKMIDDAQGYIDKMAGILKENITKQNLSRAVRTFNDVFELLINTVPRRIKRVQDIFIDVQLSCDDAIAAMRERIRIEEDLLNNMRTCVTANIIENKETEKEEKVQKKQTILEVMGISIEPCTDADMKRIMSCFTADDKREGLDKKVITAYRVVNKKTEKKFEEFKRDFKDNYKRFPCKLLWHGSRNENWWSIINNGLKIRPSNAVYTGSMFGDGLYFANKARKSYGYTSSSSAYWVRGSSSEVFMALYDVAVGNQLNTDTNYGDFGSMTHAKIRSKKDAEGNPYHSVFAHAGRQLRNDELIMYHEGQTTIKYLVKFKG